MTPARLRGGHSERSADAEMRTVDVAVDGRQRSRRVLGRIDESIVQVAKRHFDVQVMGGWIMLNGMVAEMDTGEGKTLTATLPACTVALAGMPLAVKNFIYFQF